jgi:hypothetical protein
MLARVYIGVAPPFPDCAWPAGLGRSAPSLAAAQGLSDPPMRRVSCSVSSAGFEVAAGRENTMMADLRPARTDHLRIPCGGGDSAHYCADRNGCRHGRREPSISPRTPSSTACNNRRPAGPPHRRPQTPTGDRPSSSGRPTATRSSPLNRGRARPAVRHDATATPACANCAGTPGSPGV